jgi:hypothetical protein
LALRTAPEQQWSRLMNLPTPPPPPPPEPAHRAWRRLKPEEVRPSTRLLLGKEALRGLQCCAELFVGRAEPLPTLMLVLAPSLRTEFLLDVEDPSRSLIARVVVRNREDGDGTEAVVEVAAQ